MNKAKAYRILKKKQKHIVLDWSELTSTNDRVVRLPLCDTTAKQAVTAEGNSTTADWSMFGIRSFNALKSYIEVEDLESGTKTELFQQHSSLPNISTRQQHTTRTGQCVKSTPGATQSRVSANSHSDIEAGNNNGYKLLQAKLNALILPNPVKRKASRSFSSSSSGFQGRRMAITRKDNSAIRQKCNRAKKDIDVKDTGIQFPIASKMRQLLTIEQIEQPPQSSQRGIMQLFIRLIFKHLHCRRAGE